MELCYVLLDFIIQDVLDGFTFMSQLSQAVRTNVYCFLSVLDDG